MSVRLQVLQAAHEESGAEEQQEAERDLRGDESLAQEQRARRRRRSSRSCPSASSTDRDGSRAAPAAGRRRCRSGQCSPSVKARIRRSGSGRISSGWPSAGMSASSPRVRTNASARPTTPPATREHEALDEQLPHQPAARRAERQPDGDLLLPHEAAGDEQVGDVGAGDQQHQADHAHQHDRAPSRSRCAAASSRSPRCSTMSWPFMNWSREYGDQSFAAGSVISYARICVNSPCSGAAGGCRPCSRASAGRTPAPSARGGRPCAARSTPAP